MKDQSVERAPERRGEVPVRGAGPVASLRREINHLFDRFMKRGGDHEARTGELVGGDPWAVRDPFALLESSGLWQSNFGQTDFSETTEDYEIEIDLPGLKREDVTVDYSDGILSIAGERTDEREDERRGYYLSERSHGYFRRQFRVPDNVQADDISARFADGVLKIRLPKTEEARRNTRRIEIG